ncbi:hypothetical protein FRC15_010281 [Serendipita sp. 397]|nr:hypothetical protein FRC15_010281 [Serendipita sp. 397]
MAEFQSGQHPYVNQLLWAVPVMAGFVAIRHAIRLHKLFSSIGYLPGDKTLIGPGSILGLLLPYIPFVNRGSSFTFRYNYDIFKKYNRDIISFFSFYPFPYWFDVHVADAGVAREITSNRIAFPKPIHVYKPINIYGTNVVTSENEEWKLHRRITAPSFSERNNRLVCEEGVRIVSELFELWAKQGNESRVEIEDAVETTAQFALMAIAAAGFGARFTWDDDQKPPNGYTFTFQKALNVVMSNIFYRIAFSDRILSLWQKGRDVRDAFNDFKNYMSDMIETRKQQAEEDRRADLLSNLIAGAALENSEMETTSQHSFGDDELVGNVFIFLFAGHETTAHSLAFTLALLSVHQDVQQKLYDSLISIVTEGKQPTYGDIVRWSYGLAVIYEALRLYSPVPAYPKHAAEDYNVVTYSNDGKNTPIPVSIPKGTHILINIAGLHYNPKYWKDPHDFRPERFMGDYNRDAFFSFAAGPRSCMGRRFSETEALTFLAVLVLNYRFEGTPLNEQETVEERNARLLRWKMGSLTLYPEKLPLTLVRR